MFPLKKLVPGQVRLQVIEKQRELAARKNLIDTDLYRIKFKTRQHLSQPKTLVLTFLTGIGLGVISKKSKSKPLADELVTTSVGLIRKFVITPIIGQFLIQTFRRQNNKK